MSTFQRVYIHVASALSTVIPALAVVALALRSTTRHRGGPAAVEKKGPATLKRQSIVESRTTDTEKGGQSRDASTRPNGQGNQQSSGGHNFRFQILFCAALCTYTLTNWINLAQVDAGSQQDSNALMSQVLRVQVWTELFSLTSVDIWVTYKKQPIY